jgi:hypothetical protein
MFAEAVGPTEEVILPALLPADTVLISLPIPLDIRWRCRPCQWRRDPHRMAANRADEAGTIATQGPVIPTIAGRQKSAAEEQQSVTLNIRKARGNRVSFSGG